MCGAPPTPRCAARTRRWSPTAEDGGVLPAHTPRCIQICAPRSALHQNMMPGDVSRVRCTCFHHRFASTGVRPEETSRTFTKQFCSGFRGVSRATSFKRSRSPIENPVNLGKVTDLGSKVVWGSTSSVNIMKRIARKAPWNYSALFWISNC